MTMQMKRLLNKTAELQAQIKKLTEEYDMCKAELKRKMKEQHLENCYSSKAKANYSEFTYETFDKALFKKKCPKIYKRFIGSGLQERLTITTVK